MMNDRLFVYEDKSVGMWVCCFRGFKYYHPKQEDANNHASEIFDNLTDEEEKEQPDQSIKGIF